MQENLQNLLYSKWNTIQGFIVTVVEVTDENNIIVEFNDGERLRVRLTNLKLGIIMKTKTRGVYFETAAAKYEGIVIPTVSSGADVRIKKYNDKNNVEVEFLDTGYITTTSMSNIRKGSIFNPYFVNLYGGYFGVGPYTKNSHAKIYTSWCNMMKRTSDKGRQDNPKNMSYANVTVCEEWRNYQNFALWFDTYLSSLNPDLYTDYQIDKDILQRGALHKVYSPETCCIIPSEINICMTYENMSLGNKTKEYNLPIGVHKVGSTYQINMSMYGKQANSKGSYLGKFATPEEAFAVYKREKEKVIKETAQRYFKIGAIHQDIYNVLMNWEVIDV